MFFENLKQKKFCFHMRSGKPSGGALRPQLKTELLRGRLEVVPARSHKPITQVRFLPTATKYGDVAEWFMASVLKTDEGESPP